MITKEPLVSFEGINLVGMWMLKHPLQINSPLPGVNRCKLLSFLVESGKSGKWWLRGMVEEWMNEWMNVVNEYGEWNARWHLIDVFVILSAAIITLMLMIFLQMPVRFHNLTPSVDPSILLFIHSSDNPSISSSTHLSNHPSFYSLIHSFIHSFIRWQPIHPSM